MAAGVLYTYPESFRAYKALIAAQYSGADVAVPSDFKFGSTNKSKAFLEKFPLGKVPAFEGKDGTRLVESNAIAHYVGNNELNGATPKAAAEVLQWVNFADQEILPAACTWVFPCMGIMQYNKQETDRAKEQVKKCLEVLNNTLLTRTFLVGERVSQADIAVACNLLQLYQNVLDPEFRKPYQNVNRWFTTLMNQKEFKAVIKNFQMCDKMAQFDAQKFAELHGKSKKEGKKEKEPKKEKPEKKEKAKPKPKEEAPEEEEEPKAKESKDPFEQFPRGTFNMDEFKRCYSNNDTVTVALPYFWKNLDRENYSIWFCDYREDLSKNVVFMTCNLVGGFFQRIEKMRKNAFGSMCIFGTDRNTSISGIWVWRGHELAFKLCEDWQIDYESYNWRKLDVNAPETKKMVDEYFAWEGDFDGKKFNQGKIFK